MTCGTFHPCSPKGRNQTNFIRALAASFYLKYAAGLFRSLFTQETVLFILRMDKAYWITWHQEYQLIAVGSISAVLKEGSWH
jgi:hypothetical protein